MKLKRILLLVFIAALPISISTYYPQLSDSLRNVTVGTVKPLFDFSHFVSSNITEGTSGIGNFFRVYKENAALRDEVSVLRGKLVKLEELAKENERLKAILAFKQASKARFIPAEVISRDISHFSSWVVLGKGRKDGIRPGMPIVTPLGLAGRVVATREHCARAIILTDVKSKVSGLAQRTRDLGVIEGNGCGLIMRYLPLDSKLAVGDIVVTSGLGGIYPKGIQVGKVDSIATDKEALTLYAVVKPFAELWRLEEVLCLEHIRRD
ncbi:MAG: rod shape-determining protein MreC [Candidatus Omnitrophica bacterium]|nr:rod shape-determining protein MreC [Candidatus Omnitrophota bacterium]